MSSEHAAHITFEGVRRLMWQSAGLFRTCEGLRDAVGRLDAAAVTAPGPSSRHDPESWRRLHLLSVARLIARAALRREESRGGHFRADFPERDDRHWKIHVADRREDGQPRRTKRDGND